MGHFLGEMRIWNEPLCLLSCEETVQGGDSGLRPRVGGLQSLGDKRSWKCERWSDSRYIWKVEPPGLADGLGVGYEIKSPGKKGWSCHRWRQSGCWGKGQLGRSKVPLGTGYI